MTLNTMEKQGGTSKTNDLRVSIVTNLDEFMACTAIRGAAFLARGEPFHEEFDQNDLVSSTHLLARLGRTPIGTMRVRILTAGGGGLATWERLAILPSAGRDGTKALYGLARTARAYCDFKNVGAVVGAVENPKLLKFWKKHGFETIDAPPLVYNIVEYTQIRLNLSDDAAHDLTVQEEVSLEILNGGNEVQDFDRYVSGLRLAA
jgi:hypothetical protein